MGPCVKLIGLTSEVPRQRRTILTNIFIYDLFFYLNVLIFIFNI